MLMNSSNNVLRKAVKNWDDDITRPLITRFTTGICNTTKKPKSKAISVLRPEDPALCLCERSNKEFNDLSNLSMAIPEFAKRRDWAELDRDS